jgi:ketosteroid isomerase-like protein
MTLVTYADDDIRQQLLDLEERRRAALIAVDLPTLDAMFHSDLVHIHAPGLTHNKTQLMEHISVRRPYRDSVRGELTIRLAGDLAIMTGPLINKLGSPDGTERTVGGVVTQVIIRDDEQGWKFLSFQMTPDGEHVWPAFDSEK